MKIHLVGSHSNRTPFAYDEYKYFFSKLFTYVDVPEDSDFLIFGFVKDFEPNIDIIVKCKERNPQLKIVVVSEEPLWDSLWSGDFFEKKQSKVLKGYKFDFLYLNHQNSDVFNFEKIPYFITTNNDYIVRYQMMFSRNSAMNEADIKSVWDNAIINTAFYAEFRDDEKYNAFFYDEGVFGLSNFRTKLATGYKRGNVLRVGSGWGAGNKRQALPDWHLDKLASLDMNCIYISAIENTHQKNYISEKLFDAYACLAIPLYFSTSHHKVKKIISSECFVRFDVNDLASENFSMKKFQFGIDLHEYSKLQKNLKDLFFDCEALFSERKRVVNCLYAEMNNY